MYNKISSLSFITIFLSVFMMTSCYDSDKVDVISTFTERTMGQYLRDSSAIYSEFNKLLDTTKVMGLLDATGDYTCFAPTNKAMKAFYQKMGKKTLNDFAMDSLKIMAYDHLINGQQLLFSNFVNGRLPYLSMSDRYFLITFDTSHGGFAMINKSSNILAKDILVHNGVIFKIDEVLNPTREGIVEVISKQPKFSLFYSALVATGMADSLLKIKDDSYIASKWADLITNPKSLQKWDYQVLPTARKYGYTVLMETDSTFKTKGILDFESLKKYAATIYDKMYPEDASVTDITNRRNSLNRFISYHLINKQLGYSKFIDDYVMYNNSFENSHMINSPGLNMYEYIETMCPNTLMEITRKGATKETNLINRDPDTDISIHIVKKNSDNGSINGVYHEIDGILAYTKEFEGIVSSKRLRFDAASFFPELSNNNIRGMGLTSPAQKYIFPKGYLDRLTCSDQTVVGYNTPYSQYLNYEGDEIFLSSSGNNNYDFTIVTPPVPVGTYEVRCGYLSNGRRGVAQLYFDNVPTGVPLNLNTVATDASIGYETPHTVTADYEGYENDKMMRNRGYMKGPACYRVPVTGWSTPIGANNARNANNALRKILGTYTFRTAGTHLLRVQGLSGGEFMMDYLEFVPTSVLETEDIY
jgi:uncharacterized surface protein with fasciclin (FAS1) repeats